MILLFSIFAKPGGEIRAINVRYGLRQLVQRVKRLNPLESHIGTSIQESKFRPAYSVRLPFFHVRPHGIRSLKWYRLRPSVPRCLYLFTR